jgi:hypothetical protein
MFLTQYILILIEKYPLDNISVNWRKYDRALKDFYTHRDVEGWIFLTLIFYIKSHKNKQTKFYGLTWGL